MSRAVTAVAGLALLVAAADARAALPSAAIGALPLGPPVADGLALELGVAFADGRFAYGPSLDFRGESGWFGGAGVHPWHRNRDGFDTAVGVSGRLGFGYAHRFFDVEAGAARLSLEGALRAFGQASNIAGGTAHGGAALALGFGVADDDDGGLEIVQVFGEYRPVTAGYADRGGTQVDLHGVRVGAALVYDVDEEPGLRSGFLLRAALDIREVAGANESELQLGVGLVF